MSASEKKFQHPIERLRLNAKEFPHRLAMGDLTSEDDPESPFRMETWEEVYDQCFRLAAALKSKGVEKGDRVVIMARNQAAWVKLDLAILSLGAISVPVFCQSSQKDLSFILEETQAKLFVSDQTLIQVSDSFCSLSDIENLALLFDPLDFDVRRLSQADELCTLIYTSGTTGEPKGVMHSARNIYEAFLLAQQLIGLGARDRLISYLPLSHVAERALSEFVALYVGCCTYFIDSTEKLPLFLPHVRPTLFFGVPRVWEVFQHKLRLRLKSLEKKLVWRFLPRVLKSLILSWLIKRKLGFDQTRLFASGAAKLNPETGRFLKSLGMFIHEGYGLTETMAVVSFNFKGRQRFGSVGLPLQGVEVKLSPEGEILVRGPQVFLGYYQNEAATQEVLKNGWFHTGDIGELSPDGFLSITDRKKDIFKNSGGKYIAPVALETRLKKHPAIHEALVMGENRDHCVALCSAPEGVESKEELEKFLEDVNKSVPPHERIKHLGIVSMAWTPEAGHMTPTMKLKRKVLMQKYEKEISELFETRERIVLFEAGSMERKDCANSRL